MEKDINVHLLTAVPIVKVFVPMNRLPCKYKPLQVENSLLKRAYVRCTSIARTSHPLLVCMVLPLTLLLIGTVAYAGSPLAGMLSSAQAEAKEVQLSVLAEPPSSALLINGVPRGQANGNLLVIPLRPGQALSVKLQLEGYQTWEASLPKEALGASSLYLFRRLKPAGYCGFETSREDVLKRAETDALSAKELNSLRVCFEKEKKWNDAILVTRKFCERPDSMADCRFNLGKSYNEVRQYRSCAYEMRRVIRNPLGLTLCIQLKAYEYLLACSAEEWSLKKRPGESIPGALEEDALQFKNALANWAREYKGRSTSEEAECLRASQVWYGQWENSIALEE